jgi:hypothetical protein
MAILGMNLTKTVHPPEGAVAIRAVVRGEMIEGIGYGYCLTAMCGSIYYDCSRCLKELCNSFPKISTVLVLLIKSRVVTTNFISYSQDPCI